MKSTSYSTAFFWFFSPFESIIKAVRKILFSMLKLCLDSSSTADIRHFILVDLDDQGLNKTCTSSEHLHSPHPSCVSLQEYGFKYWGTYRRKDFPDLNKGIAFGQFEQRAVAPILSVAAPGTNCLENFSCCTS